MYLATEPSGAKKAVKVISKEQLKSSKNKGKVRPLATAEIAAQAVDPPCAQAHHARSPVP